MCDLCNYCLMEAKKEKAATVKCRKCGAEFRFIKERYKRTKKGKKIKYHELFDDNGIFEYGTPS